MGYPRFRRARSHKFLRRTSGSIVLNGVAWANVDTGLDLTTEAQVGDTIRYSINGLWSNEAVRGMLDVVTFVGAAPVNAFGQNGGENGANSGVTGWIGPASVETGLSGSIMYVLTSADIGAGLGVVTIRLRGRTGTAANKTLLATATDPLLVAIENLGPVDPN